MNAKLWAYASGMWWRRRRHNIPVALLLALLLALLGGALLTAGALEAAVLDSARALPAITVQRLQGGRLAPIPTERVYAIAELPGVDWARARLWGYQYFEPAGITFVLVGLDPWLDAYRPQLTRVLERIDADALNRRGGALIGKGVQRALAEVYHHPDALELQLPDGSRRRLPVVGRFRDDTALLSGDLVLTSRAVAREALGLEPGAATDIVVAVPNPDEVPVLVRKIQQRFADVRLVTRAQLVRSYRSLFDTRAGLLLGLYAIVLAGFLILVLDRAAGLSAAERREIGMLKAVGWSTAAVVRVKLIEALTTGLVGVGLGLALALSWVFWLDAPGLLAVFSGWERVRPGYALPATLDASALLLTALLGLATYLAAALVPAWRAAARDPDEVLR